MKALLMLLIWVTEPALLFLVLRGPKSLFQFLGKSITSDISTQESPNKTDRELKFRSLSSFGAREKFCGKSIIFDVSPQESPNKTNRYKSKSKMGLFEFYSCLLKNFW